MSATEFRVAQQRMLERYRVTAQSRFIELAAIDGRAHMLVVGDGPTVLMINGLGTPAAMWAPLLAQIQGFRLCAIDLPGFGLTEGTMPTGHAYRPAAVRILCETLDRLELDQAAIIANSLGSLWTLWLALDAPDRLATMVHLGCPATILGTSAPLPMRLLSVPPLARIMMGLQPPSHRQVEQLSKMVHEYPLAPELADLLLATERLPGFEREFVDTLHTLVRLRGARPEIQLDANQLRRVRQPTQLIWGTDDPMGSTRIAREVAEAIPDAELHLIDGGHAPWLRQSKAIGALAKSFLGKHCTMSLVVDEASTS